MKAIKKIESYWPFPPTKWTHYLYQLALGRHIKVNLFSCLTLLNAFHPPKSSCAFNFAKIKLINFKQTAPLTIFKSAVSKLKAFYISRTLV